jgi:hypothetical protein
MITTNFISDINKGKIGENIFKEDFLQFLKINYEDVSGCQRFQVIDADFLTKIGLYEIKTNYKDDEILIFEDYTNYNTSLGWVYKTKADLIIFISVKTRTMVFLPFDDNFKNNYKSLREKTELFFNKPSEYNGNIWRSAFRKIPFTLLKGYISIYQKK